METLTTIDKVERTPSGAYKLTLMGGVIAGTKDEAIGALAVTAVEHDHPVALELSKQQGKLHVTNIELIEAPPELGGPEETSGAHEADGTGQAVLEPAERSPGAPAPEDCAKQEAIAPGNDTLPPAGDTAPESAEPETADSPEKGSPAADRLACASDAEILEELAARLSDRIPMEQC